MTMQPFKSAMIQMLVEGGRKDANLRCAQELIAEAAAAGSVVAVLPESMDLGWTHPSARSEAEPVPDGAVCRMLREAARKHGIYICSSLTELAPEGVYNSAVLIDPAGRVLAHHRKINELDIAGTFISGEIASTWLTRLWATSVS